MPFTHVVKQGDCLLRIAAQYGFADWKSIYEHGDNADFRKKRPNPNAIFPGDLVAIPDKEEKELEVPSGAKHRFKVKLLRTMLRVLIKDEKDEPLAGKQFELKLGGETYEGVTNGEGFLEQTVPETDEQGELTVWATDDKEAARYFWNVRVGHLDPVEEIHGVQQRLNNLGFYCGDADGKMSEELRLALRGFQDVAGIEKTGAIDDVTKSKLVEMHGDM